MTFNPCSGSSLPPSGGETPARQKGQRRSTRPSPGHNVEFAWLLLHAADILGIPRAQYADVLRRKCDHCVEFGIDHEYGGVYADVPMTRPTTQTEKQFWQQAEVLIGMLDAYALLGDEKYWQAFRNVYDFVFSKMVVMEAGGEWYERVDRAGTPLDRCWGTPGRSIITRCARWCRASND